MCSWSNRPIASATSASIHGEWVWERCQSPTGRLNLSLDRKSERALVRRQQVRPELGHAWLRAELPLGVPKSSTHETPSNLSDRELQPGLAIWLIQIPVPYGEYRYRIERHGWCGQAMPGLASLLNNPCVEEGRTANGRALEVTQLFVCIVSFNGGKDKLDVTEISIGWTRSRRVATSIRASEPPSSSTAPRIASTVLAMVLSETAPVPPLRSTQAFRPCSNPTFVRWEFWATFLIVVQSAVSKNQTGEHNNADRLTFAKVLFEPATA